MKLDSALVRVVFQKEAQSVSEVLGATEMTPSEILNVATMAPAGTNYLGAPPPRPSRSALTDFMTSWYSLRGLDPTRGDISSARAALARAEARLAAGKVDIRPAGGGVPRILVDKRDIAPQTVLKSDYQPGGMAIPELGQINFTTWRKPFSYHHVHRHPDFWTVHKDKYPSMGQAFRGQTDPSAGGTGAAHVAREGVPGLFSYIRAATGNSNDFTAGHRPAFSLFRALGSDAPRSRQEFLTQVYDFGAAPVAGARRRTAIRLGAGAGALGVSAIALLAIRQHLRRKQEEAEAAAASHL